MRSLFVEHFLPLPTFCHFPDRLVTILEHFPHVTRKVNGIEPSSCCTIWCFKMKKINHYRSIFTGLEVVFMFHALEISFRLFVCEHMRLLHFRDLYPQQAVLEEVAGFPGYRIILFNQAKAGAGHSFLAEFCHGLFMHTNMTAEIKNNFNRGSYKGSQMNSWHNLNTDTVIKIGHTGNGTFPWPRIFHGTTSKLTERYLGDLRLQ